MKTIKLDGKSKLAEKIATAADFHGHLGPFLVIGVRMAMLARKILDIDFGHNNMEATVKLPLLTPYSCILDGIQATTKCTIGNQKLKFTDSPDITAKFTLLSKREVIIALNSAVYEKLNSQLSRKSSLKEVERLALQIASISEEDLFEIRKDF